ncbi:MAG: XrtA system polysaccharide deacetylase, partial [Pseudomonadota bacterium]
NIDKALGHLDDNDAKATFFTLGWVAENHPRVVRRIVDAGHEIASHGMQHVRVWSQTSDEFLADASRSKKLLEDVAGSAVRGYRAASWSIDERTPWAWDQLARAGYEYSSSIYPVSHDHYGSPDSPTEAYVDPGSGLLEIPASTTSLLGRRVPIAGGGYFRLYPLSVSRWLIRRQSQRSSAPYIFYFHPWELDPAQPRMAQADRKAKFRHYLNLDKFESRWLALLRNYRWGRMDRLYVDSRMP